MRSMAKSRLVKFTRGISQQRNNDDTIADTVSTATKIYFVLMMLLFDTVIVDAIFIMVIVMCPDIHSTM